MDMYMYVYNYIALMNPSLVSDFSRFSLLTYPYSFVSSFMLHIVRKKIKPK